MTSKKFAAELLVWNRNENHRDLPWKGEKNAYMIWLSEIIMQQTRVKQGLPYFLRFKKKYPTVDVLALAHEDDVLKLWQGLGYYSRARNLHHTAKFIHLHLNGIFPDNFSDLKKLKGVGDYTAAAIASFAFGEKKAVVDGNVIRVIARIFGVTTPFDSTKGKKEFAILAQQLIDEKEPAAYNQAIMDFGALVCSPQNPKCDQCPFNKVCVAYKRQLIDALPYRKKKTKVKDRWFNYLIIENGKQIWVNKRTGNDIWKNLYELPLIETHKQLKKNPTTVVRKFLGTNKFKIDGTPIELVQLLSHRKIHFRFIRVVLQEFNLVQLNCAHRVSINTLRNLAVPRTIHLVLRENGLV